MLQRAKNDRLKMPWTTVLCGLFFAAACPLLHTSVVAQCANWNASGPMKIWQRGQPYPIELALQQRGVVVSGTAALIVASEGRRIEGPVDGAIEGSTFSVQIFWNDHQIGVYNAKILPSGRLDGEGWEKNTPKVHVTWYSDGFLKCPPPPGSPFIIGSHPPKPAPPPPIKSSGKMRHDPAPTPKPPWIVASQTVFPFPGSVSGFVVLTWDAGPDHPNAEIWLKTPNGVQTVAKTPKGGLQIPVERGRFYEYDIGEAGRIWAGVTFTAN